MSLFTLNDAKIHAVKAIIYRDNGKALLQQRDYSKDLLFPGHWTFFGGLVEQGETINDALHRELVEELGCIPGEIEDELFAWEWHGENPSRNHYFPLRCKVDDDHLSLNEGRAMAWFSIDEMKAIPLTPGLKENLTKVEALLKQTLLGQD
jgi:8-oxo-dGTP diphosphatase